MRIRRSIIVPALLTLGVVGSLLTGSAVSAAAGHQTSVHSNTVAVSATPNTHFRT